MRPWSRRSRGRRGRELDTEIEAHLEMAARDRIERGEAPEAARLAALREFGTRALVEVTREMWGRTWLDTLVQDLRYGWRTMRRPSRRPWEAELHAVRLEQHHQCNNPAT